jgi:hypothetical protein
MAPAPLSCPQLALLGKLLQLLRQPAYRLLVLLLQFPPDGVVSLAVLLVLLIGGDPLQLIAYLLPAVNVFVAAAPTPPVAAAG